MKPGSILETFFSLCDAVCTDDKEGADGEEEEEEEEEEEGDWKKEIDVNKKRRQNS